MNLPQIYLILFTLEILYFIATPKIRNKNRLTQHINPNIAEQPKINNEISAYCFASMDGAVYDLNILYDAKEDYSIITADKKNTFYFNFCNFAITKCKKERTYAILTRDKVLMDKSRNCTMLSGTNRDKAPKWTIIKADASGNKEDKILIKLPDGEPCKKGNELSFYSTTYEISCDKNVARLNIDNTQDLNPNSCSNVIKMRSMFACPNFNRYSLANTIRANAPIFGLILIVFGVYYCWFAYKYIKLTCVLTGVAIVCFISFFVFANNLNVTFSSASFWAMLVMSILVGLGLGWVIINFPWIVSSSLGGLLGFIFTELLYQMIASSLTWNPKGVYWIIFSISVATGFVLGGVFQKHVFIIACGFLGSYAMIRGLAAIENNFPNEQLIFDLIENKEWPQLEILINYKLYLYLIFVILLGFFGVCFQYRNYFKDIKDDEPLIISRM